MIRRPTVLCVDDDVNCLVCLTALLEHEGYRVRIAESGVQALEEFAAHKVDAVILDYQMPLMNGDEVAARMKRTKSFVPIILLSGCDNFSDSDFPLVDRVVRKGEGPTELMTTLHSLLLTSASPIARWLRREEARNDTTKGAF
jgi:DNA-binding response OmpR family regulator